MTEGERELSDVDHAWNAVREELRLASVWDKTRGMRVATRPNPLREIRYLVAAVRREA